ncbi:MAG TPA: hypothetical protein VFA43_24820, partial [Gemmatimonadaceae bacterium]|nr:hypothetical protein [Gemmatimonadaceae bacterium]
RVAPVLDRWSRLLLPTSPSGGPILFHPFADGLTSCGRHRPTTAHTASYLRFRLAYRSAKGGPSLFGEMRKVFGEGSDLRLQFFESVPRAFASEFEDI